MKYLISLIAGALILIYIFSLLGNTACAFESREEALVIYAAGIIGGVVIGIGGMLLISSSRKEIEIDDN